jgi:predicted NUDIX family NTP pyrophosphohydrolase
MATNDNTRAAALVLLKNGCATVGEVARMAGESRQLVQYWAHQAGLDVPAIRAAYLELAWREAVTYVRKYGDAN